MRRVRGLALLVGVLGTLVYWPRPEVDAAPTRRLPVLAALHRIEVAGPGLRNYALVRAGETWRLDGRHALEPVRLRALEEALGEGAALEAAEAIADTEVRRSLGLEAPATLRFTDGAGESWDLQIGRSVARAGTYVAIPGEAHGRIASAPLRALFLRDPDAWRDRRVLPEGATANLRGLRLERDRTPLWAVTRQADGRWTTSEAGDPLDQAAVEDLRAALGTLRADRFLPDAAPPPPVLHRLTLQVEASDLELGFGPPDGEGGRPVRGPAGWVHLRRHQVATLPFEPSALRDRRPLPVEPDRVTHISLEGSAGGGAPLRLERVGEGWHLRAPREGRVDPALVDAQLRRWTSLRAAPAPAAPPQVERGPRVELGVQGEAPVWAELGAPFGAGGRYLRASARRGDLVVPAGQLAEMWPGPAWLEALTSSIRPE